MEQFIPQTINKTSILTGERSGNQDSSSGGYLYFCVVILWEGLPYTIIEAMMAGLPVVATSVGGVPELVENNKTGFLVPSDNPEKMAEAIDRLLENKELRIKMGKEGQRKALKEFTLERMIAQTQNLYQEVLNKK